MLFSNPDIASYINKSFEPAWESVRPVPTVHFDFGDDALVTRTLHGNIATYVCNAEGNVLDILPGAYDAETYLTQLQELRSLVNPMEDATRSLEQLHAYHAVKLAIRGDESRTTNSPARQPDASSRADSRVADFSKVLIIEKPIETVLASGTSTPAIGAASEKSRFERKMQSNLAQDTSYNEVYRRAQIHKRLAQSNWTTPRPLTKWLYREVLNTDLDDPYLGMKDLLFADYPFADDLQEPLR